MSQRRLNHYKGELSAAQIAEGMNAAARNAIRLAEDAELLMENKRYPSATSLAILSIEESGKVAILRGLSVARNDKELKEAWKDYRSHTKKNVAWILIDMIKAGARKLDDFIPMFKEDAEHPYILDNLKQIGFYTDCLCNAHWSFPEEVIDEDIAKMVVYLAKIFVSKKEITEKEIELWIKHLGPVWKKHIKWMQQALENWYHEMQECGFAPEGPNEIRNFIKTGIKITKDP